MKRYSISELTEGVRAGDKRLLGKAITLVESTVPTHRLQAEELLQALMPYTGKSVRIGVTGVPGAGKSTFIESFGQLAIQNGKRVAVLAIDPSSTRNKGSILGDKTRMEELSRHSNAFIRPSPSSGFLGGVANATFESMLICEAAGYDFILIETVGVGQSEVLVADMVDVFLFLKIIGGGDELQGIKRGIMEMVDLIFINKINDENRRQAKNTKVELLRALHFMPSKEERWKVPVLLGSALENEGLNELFLKMQEFIELKKASHSFHDARRHQAEKRFDYWVQQYILQKTQSENKGHIYNQLKQNAADFQENPSSAAKKFVDRFFD